MSPITIEAIEAKQTELSALIQKFKEQPKVKVINIESRTVELLPGERYAGAKLDDHGNHLHDTIVLAARSNETHNFDGAQQWAKSVGGDAPSPEECALIKANCPDVLTRWYWTGEEYDASDAWYFYSDGHTSLGSKFAAGGALAVRRA